MSARAGPAQAPGPPLTHRALDEMLLAAGALLETVRP